MMACRRASCKAMSYQEATNGDSRHRHWRRTIGRPALGFVVLLGGLMAGCSSGSGPGASVAGGSPEASPQPSLELASPKSPGAGGVMETYVGTLGSDAIEGGCAYLQTADGVRYEVVYPQDWELRKSPLELVAPDGRVVAGAGDEITVRGAEADMMSICQIGPIIKAAEVVVGG
jgi:hypothetical protein